ncbi:hypothetical protein ONR57_21175 [Hoyosella sp. YIM 151337]|uniref:hypothetical protein n=1 Tax=Hoyosella sp. YIM 151337 TaxID=2992742 RepID=UPI0022363ADA|nr:hypothetical protein [Hoyosella sp. YIM 151337]MCW4355820.1 hypothetical protein [Hoyosella sp. YIM 151337]
MTDAEEAPDSVHGDSDGDEAAVVTAREIVLNGTRGRVYGPCTFDIPAGELTVIKSRPGSGRTALLLSVTGRMRPSSGGLTVLGLPYPKRGKAIRAHTAIAGFDDIDDLDESVTVGEAIRERLVWAAPWYRRVRKVSDDTAMAICAPVFGDRAVPPAKTVIWELGQLDQLLLRVALALVPDPYLLAVDDFEQVESDSDRAFFTERLCAIAPSCTVVSTAVDTVSGYGICHVDLGADSNRAAQAAQ